MELAREERELAKPKNWGKVNYQNIRLRQIEIDEGTYIPPPPVPVVRNKLEQNPVVTGTLDATEVIRELGENEQCDFFSRYPKCTSLIITHWNELSYRVLRCISITFGENLLELDLSNSTVNDTLIQVILVRSTKLKILRLNECSNINTQTMAVIVKLVSQSLAELHLSNCPNVTTEAMQWIGGCVGFQAQSLGKLKMLDLGSTPAKDNGIIAISQGCKRLSFLNLDSCSELTDNAVVSIVKASKRMQVLNLSGCSKITNKSMAAIGKNCPELVSLNVSRCPLISDPGAAAVAAGCRNLQAMNLAGDLKISELSMFNLTQCCKGLLTLNVTGCERITVNGLNALIEGLDYVEAGVTFMGFKPIDAHVALKLNTHLERMQSDAIKLIRDGKLRQQTKLERDRQNRDQYLNSKASIIQTYMYRYKLRMIYYHMWRSRVEKEKALLLQRVYRGYRGRLIGHQYRAEYELFLLSSPEAMKIQRNVRGYLCRLRTRYVAKAVKQVRSSIRAITRRAMLLKIQCAVRRYLAIRFVREFREIRTRQRANRNDAALVLQQTVRGHLSRTERTRRQRIEARIEEGRRRAEIKIKTFCVEGMRRYKSQLTGEQLKRFYRHKWTAAVTIQSFYRGYNDREVYRHIKIDLATGHYAATQIQRVFRGSRVLPWQDIRLNVIAAFVLDRQFLERRDSVSRARQRYRQYLEENRLDSASEEEDDEVDSQLAWVKSYDATRRMPMWQNFETSEATYDEPMDALAQQKGLVGRRIKVFWTVQNAWYEGIVARYHKKKRRHRVEYDDGDHEWIDLQAEAERVQVMQDDFTWVMYVLYQSPQLIREFQKVDEVQRKREFQQQAFRDAQQWQLISNANDDKVMFLSTKTGEIRTGMPDAMEWDIQDDGLGYPCFVNVRTNAVVYEDPRFVYDVDADLEEQRNYVMQELRYALYICKDLWEKYERAEQQQDLKAMQTVAMQIKNSPKLIHLSSFVIRAKGLYVVTSVVDKSVNQSVWEELEYAQWLAERLAEIVEYAHDLQRLRKDAKVKHVTKLLSNPDEVLHCQFCGRETKRHLDFCANCGKFQVFY